ncbi:unnamed protein product, partial [Urochloa humidicola]
CPSAPAAFQTSSAFQAPCCVLSPKPTIAMEEERAAGQVLAGYEALDLAEVLATAPSS